MSDETPRINIYLPSVQSLLIQMNFNGTPIGTGTGFVANSAKGPVLITNRHNVTGRHQETGRVLSQTGGLPNHLLIMHNHTNGFGTWLPCIEPLYLTDTMYEPRWIEHPTLGSRADFVALPLTQLQDVQLYPYTLGTDDVHILIAPTALVSVIGFPFGLQYGGSLAVWATGFIASEPGIEFNGLPLFLIDCRGRPGQSGSPVVAYISGGAVAVEGGGTNIYAGSVSRFLGIYSGRINDQSDLGFVWKVGALQELVNSIT